MNAILGFSGFVCSLSIYLLIARQAGKSVIRSPEQFFLSRGNHDSDQFAASQISYALQMATVYPFFVFAVTHAWWLALVNTFFYAVGIALLTVSIRRFGRVAPGLIRSSRTLHSFISTLHRSSRLRTFTAWMSIIGFTGLTAFEIVFGARILRVLFGGNESIYYLSILVLGIYLVLYLWLGGQRGTINSGQLLLVLAYVGMHAAVIWAVLQPSVSVNRLDAPILVPLVLVNSLLMFAWRVRGLVERRSSLEAKVLSIVTLASLLSMTVALASMKGLLSLSALTWRPIDRTPSFIWQLTALGLLPIFFQFVDMTTWQRLAALSERSEVRLRQELQQSLLQYLIESPLSWLLPVLLGVCAAVFIQQRPDEDPWDQFIATILAVHGFRGALLSLLVVSGVAAIFLSTADGLLSAIGYSFTYDLGRRSRQMLDHHQSDQWASKDVDFIVSKGRHAMAGILAIVLILFMVADIGSRKGDTVLGLFLAFFTPMIAFAPAVVIPVLCGRRAPSAFAWASIAGGGILGMGCGVASVFYGGVWQWAAPDVAIAVSWIAYACGLPFGTSLYTEVSP